MTGMPDATAGHVASITVAWVPSLRMCLELIPGTTTAGWIHASHRVTGLSAADTSTPSAFSSPRSGTPGLARNYASWPRMQR